MLKNREIFLVRGNVHFVESLTASAFCILLQRDSSGDPKYYSIVRSYITSTYVIVLVFDVTNRASFERIRSHWAGPDNMWALEKGILVGNKCDLELRRSVNASEARALADDLGLAAYLETDSTDYESVQKLAKAIARGGSKLEKSIGWDQKKGNI